MRTRFRVALILISSLLLAQEYRGTFSGKITDPQNAPVPGARITATETNTGTRTQGMSESTGAYTLSFLAPGTYQITVEAPGFKQYLQTGSTDSGPGRDQCRQSLV
jgi:hypothetical protein